MAALMHLSCISQQAARCTRWLSKENMDIHASMMSIFSFESFIAQKETPGMGVSKITKPAACIVLTIF